MKARFVFEAIEFERGQDPKRAMGIGNSERQMEYEINRVIQKTMDRFADGKIQFDWDYSDDLEIYRELNAWIPCKDKENREKIKKMMNDTQYDNLDLFHGIYDAIDEEGYQLQNYNAYNWGVIKKKGIRMVVSIG